LDGIGAAARTALEDTFARPAAETAFAAVYGETASAGAQADGTVDLDAIFARASAVYDIPEDLLKAVARAESGFNPNAVSRSGAVGVMQLMPGTARALGVADSYDPEQNIMGGAKYLRQMLDEFGGDVELALAAYNAGPGAVRKYGGVPPYEETQNYVRTVAKYAGESVTAGVRSVRTRTSESGIFATSGNDSANAALVEMYLLKLLEMEMRDEDDEDGRGGFGL
jgi:soluble lytic murein transglycosylase-like protein